MAQQINLLDERFVPRREPFGARATLALVTAAVLAAGGGVAHLRERVAVAQAAAAAEQQRTDALRAQIAPMAARLAALDGGELARLRAIDAAQQRQLAAWQAATARPGDPPSAPLLALARQANSAVWLTSFAIDGDGDMTIEGRMLDTSALPQHLRRLNAEPHFAGRPFAQLDMQRAPVAGDQPDGPSLVEFRLRSRALPGTPGAAPAPSPAPAAAPGPATSPLARPPSALNG